MQMREGRLFNLDRAGRGTSAAAKSLKKDFRPPFWVFGIFEGAPLHRQMTPRPVQHGGRVKGPEEPNHRQCLA